MIPINNLLNLPARPKYSQILRNSRLWQGEAPPFMIGENLGKEVMRLRPDIPVILCTGYSNLISPEKATTMRFRGFIMKPFTLREGAELVRSVLDQRELSNLTKKP